MTSIKSEEQWAQSIIAIVLGQQVDHNDTGEEDSMYDLRIGAESNPKVAIEVTGAVHQNFTHLWNTSDRSFSLKGVSSDWEVEVDPNIPTKNFKNRLTKILIDLEKKEVEEVEASLLDDGDLKNSLDSLQIKKLSKKSDGRNISLKFPPTVGTVNSKGDGVADWIERTLSGESFKDVRHKLMNLATADKKHVFIPVTPHGASEEVESYLESHLTDVPSQEPVLPEGITGVWVVHTYARQGVYWNGTEWKLIDQETVLEAEKNV